MNHLHLCWSSLFLLLLLATLAYVDAVDTHQFGLIATGMSEADVQRRLGPPDQVVEGRRTFVPERSRDGRTEVREKRRYLWVYAGDSQTLRTVITFEDGEVVSKEKGR